MQLGGVVGPKGAGENVVIAMLDSGYEAVAAATA